jgi:hypothetical protein
MLQKLGNKLEERVNVAAGLIAPGSSKSSESSEGEGAEQSAAATGAGVGQAPRPQLLPAGAGEGAVSAGGTTASLPSGALGPGSADADALTGASEPRGHGRRISGFQLPPSVTAAAQGPMGEGEGQPLIQWQHGPGPFLRAGSDRHGASSGPTYAEGEEPAAGSDSHRTLQQSQPVRLPGDKFKTVNPEVAALPARPGLAGAALASMNAAAPCLTESQIQGLQKLALSEVLRERAAAGVKVYVQMYKEVPATLALNSQHQKRVLTGAHPNIHVIRHGSWFWTHHEKIVCVDRQLAF